MQKWSIRIREGRRVASVSSAPRVLRLASLFGGSPARLICAFLCLIWILALTTACTSPHPSVPNAPSGPETIELVPPAPLEASVTAYRLGPVDQLRVIVFGEEDLSGEFHVDDTGAVSIPLVGDVVASGQTLRSFEAAVRERLSDGRGRRVHRTRAQPLGDRP